MSIIVFRADKTFQVVPVNNKNIYEIISSHFKEGFLHLGNHIPSIRDKGLDYIVTMPTLINPISNYNPLATDLIKLHYHYPYNVTGDMIIVRYKDGEHQQMENYDIEKYLNSIRPLMTPPDKHNKIKAHVDDNKTEGEILDEIMADFNKEIEMKEKEEKEEKEEI